MNLQQLLYLRFILSTAGVNGRGKHLCGCTSLGLVPLSLGNSRGRASAGTKGLQSSQDALYRDHRVPWTSFSFCPPISGLTPLCPQELLCPSEGLGLWGECPELCSSLGWALPWGQPRLGWDGEVAGELGGPGGSCAELEHCWERKISVCISQCLTVLCKGSFQGGCGAEPGLLDGR